MHAVIIIMLILAILLVIFTLQNSFEISINVFFWEIYNAPLVLVLLICILLGYLLAVVYFWPRLYKLERKYRHTLTSEKKLENRLGELQQNYESHPEGIELDVDDEDDENEFFKD